jgi:broad specificity phosphatase PhoE
MGMTELIFIRHAETDLSGTFCGHSDPPVNQRGELQIQELIARLRTARIHTIVSSDLRRAQHTAVRIAEAFHIPLSTSSALREIHFGTWETLRWEDIEARDPIFAKRWTEAFPHIPAPQGEAFAMFKERVLREIQSVAEQNRNKRIAIVTHAGVMRLALQYLLGVSAEIAWMSTKTYCSSFVYRPCEIGKAIPA